MGPALLWARAEWQRRRVALVALVLFVAIGSGVVLTVAAGAHRTATAYDRLVDATNRYDVYVQDDGVAEGNATVVDDLAALPGVAAVDELVLVIGTVEGSEILLAGGVNGAWGTDLDTPRVTEGRAPRPTSIDEVLLNAQSAREFGLAVGDRLSVATLDTEQLQALFATGDFPDELAGPTLDLTVVGVGRLPDDLDNPDAAALISPALVASIEQRDVGRLQGMARVDLADGGPAALDAFVEAMRALPDHDPDSVYVTFGKDDSARVVDGIVVQATALWVFAAAAVIAVAVAVGQALARAVNTSRPDRGTFAALGATDRQTALVFAAPFVPVLAAGVALGAAASVVASTLFPFGLARRAEPQLGLRFDPTVHAGGAVVMLVFALGALALLSMTAARPARSTAAKPSTVSRLAAGIGMRPAALTGVRLALDPGRGERRSPVRSTLAGVGIGVAFVVAALVFGSSLERLVASPRLYGTPWDLIASGGEDRAEVAATANPLLDDAGVSGIGLATFREIEIDGLGVESAAVESLKGTADVDPLSGRVPLSAREVALGPKTAAALGVSIGDEVGVRLGAGGTRTLTVVGTVLHSAEDGEQLGVGAVLTHDGLDELAGSTGYNSLLIDLAPRVDAEAVVESLGPGVDVAEPEPPAAVTNIDLAKSTPRLLAAFLCLLAIAAAAHGITTSLRRGRHDIAVLRALGLVRRDVGVAVAWQASLIAGVAIVVALPVGVLLGRQLWRVVAERVPVIPEVEVPLAAIGLVAVAAVVVANVLAVPPGVIARRVRAASVLRTE